MFGGRFSVKECEVVEVVGGGTSIKDRKKKKNES